MFIDKHLERLKRDSERLRINNVSFEEIKRQIDKVSKNYLNGIIRVTISRSSGERGYLCKNQQPVYWISINPWPEHIIGYQQTGINVRLCEQRLSHNPSLAGIKHCNRLEQVLARNEWAEDEFQEGLMRDYNDHLIEGTMSNLFYIKQDKLFTPELTGSGVNGIMRAEVIAVAKRLNIPIVVAAITVEQIKQADTVFVTNSVIAIWRVNQFEEIIYSTNSNAIFDKIKAEIINTLSL